MQITHYHNIVKKRSNFNCDHLQNYKTRMHSSRVPTDRLWILSYSIPCISGGSPLYADPPHRMQTPPDVDPPPPWTEGMAHACENISFRQLLLRVVIVPCIIWCPSGGLFGSISCWPLKNLMSGFGKPITKAEITTTSLCDSHSTFTPVMTGTPEETTSRVHHIRKFYI